MGTTGKLLTATVATEHATHGEFDDDPREGVKNPAGVDGDTDGTFHAPLV